MTIKELRRIIADLPGGIDVRMAIKGDLEFISNAYVANIKNQVYFIVGNGEEMKPENLVPEENGG